jgi:cyanophycin synthetase
MKATIQHNYYGPSLFAPRPVIVWELDIGHDAARRIMVAAPAALKQAYGRPFEQSEIRHPDPEVGVALIMSRWCMDIQQMANGLVYDAGAARDEAGVVRGWVGYLDPQSGTKALQIAINSIIETGHANPFPSAATRDAIAKYRLTAVPPHHDYIGRIVAMGAHARGIPVMPSRAGARMWQYGWGTAGRVFFEAVSDRDGSVGVKLSQQKTATTRFLHGLGYPATEQRLASNADSAVSLARSLGGPVVVKPVDQGKGRGVTVGITREDDIRKAFAEASVHGEGPIIIEKFVPGFDHRLLVVGGRLLAAARREPASVTGDGQRTIAQLVQALNRQRAADPIAANYLKQIAADQILLDHLRLQDANLETVLHRGRTVTLRSNANISTGGTPTNVLDVVHPDIRAMAESIARNAGLNAIGIDYITPDISRSWRETAGAIIEFNAAPGLDVHVGSGMDPAALGGAILGDVGRIPLAVVIAPAGEQAGLLDALAGPPAEWRCGVVAAHGITICGADLLPHTGDLHGRVGQVLENRDCAVALICATVEEINLRGFPVDRCELAVIHGDVADDAAAITLAYRCADSVIRQDRAAAWSAGDALNRIRSVLGTVACVPQTLGQPTS